MKRKQLLIALFLFIAVSLALFLMVVCAPRPYAVPLESSEAPVQIDEATLSESLQMADFLLDDFNGYIWFGVWTNWGNCTWTIWDNSTLQTYNEYEGTYRLAKNASEEGKWHNLTILVNGTDVGGQQAQQEINFTITGNWLWVNYAYTYYSPAALNDLFYTMIWSWPEPYLYYHDYAYPDHNGEMAFCVFGEPGSLNNETAYLRVTELSYYLYDMWFAGYYRWVYGEWCFVAPINTEVLRDMAGSSLDDTWHNFTVRYDGRQVNSSTPLEDEYDSGWLSHVFPYWNYKSYTQPDIYIDGSELFHGPATAMYLIVENGSMYSSTRMRWDVKIYHYSQYCNYSLYDTYPPTTPPFGMAPMKFTIIVDNVVSGWGDGRFAVSDDDEMVLDIYCQDFSSDALTSDSTVEIQMDWGIAFLANSTIRQAMVYVPHAPTALLVMYQASMSLEISGVTSADMKLAFFDTADNWVPFETLDVNITYGGNTYYLTSPLANVPASGNITLEVFNKWGVLLSNTTFTYEQYKAIQLNLYELIMDNEADHLVRVDMSYNGTYPNITIMLPRNFPRFLYLAPANYTIIFTYYSPVEGNIVNYEEETGYYITYEYELTDIGYLKYTGISMTDIYTNIDYTREVTNNNIDIVDHNVLAIPYPPPVPQNVVTPEMLWLVVGAFGVIAIIFAIGGHGIKGWQIAKKQKIFFKNQTSNYKRD